MKDDRTLMDEDNARFSAVLATICGVGIAAICAAAVLWPHVVRWLG